MPSTRESSPAIESSSLSPNQLTPTSKVRALLANFDKDSDDESASGPVIARVRAALRKTSPAKSLDNIDISQTQTQHHASTIEEEEEEIVRPKGRWAAQMMANQNGSEEDIEPTRVTARNISSTKSKSPKPASNNGLAISSDESDAPVISRKRKIRTRRETPESSPTKSAGSPGLFVSPSVDKSTNANQEDDTDSDLPIQPPNDDRFKALVQKKREERLAREAEEAKDKDRKIALRKKQARQLEEDDDDIDEQVERRLTQPTRKASKKAQEEIRRETQRMSRNQQLAHNAVTKKKYPKSDFLAKFNFRQETKQVSSDPAKPLTSSSPASQSDIGIKDTPPTSPASYSEDIDKPTENMGLQSVAEEVQQMNDDSKLPTLEEVFFRLPSSPPTRSDKGKGRAVEEPISVPKPQAKTPFFTQRPIRVRAPKVNKSTISLDDSESDLEIVSAKTSKSKKLDAMFDRIPAKQAREPHSIQALRMLALVKSPGRKILDKNKKPSMTTGELDVSLQQKARQQATREREERLQVLRDRGIIVQTAEEREKEAAEVEDLISKARREGEEIMKREKEAAKMERKANGEVDPVGESSDDEDWEETKAVYPSGSGSDNEEDEGSENEDMAESGDEEDEELDGQDSAPLNPLFDNEAAESDNDEVEDNLSINDEQDEDADIEEDEQLPTQRHQRRNRKAIISDDEDEEPEPSKKTTSVLCTQSPMQTHQFSPKAPNSVLRSATKTFIPGVTVAGPAGLGLTQIFAGTMDESQMDDEEVSPTQQLQNDQGSMAFLRRLPAPTLPPFIPTMEEDTQDLDTVMDSQPVNTNETQLMDSESQGIELNFSQSQMHGFDSLVQDSQLSQFPEATQDLGFQHTTPIGKRFMDAPPSTVDTMVLPAKAAPEAADETFIIKKKGKLRQRVRVTVLPDEEHAEIPEEEGLQEDEFDPTDMNVFDIMRKASKKKKVANEFDKKNSRAKEMVNEQAEESEDEYAGLGGNSDDESGGEEDALVKEMIDDEGGKDVDERQIAAFFADRERASDEKAVEKLYKDITKGMLRRRRGADYDLSDSDDGGEARQRRKRAEFAKMRKALLADERIGKIAENPKRQAFLRAIEDRGSDDEMDFLDDFAEQEEATETQSQSQADGSPQVVPDSQPTEMGPPKRKRSEGNTEAGNRLPPNLRRTKNGKKPTNLSEIRESLSSLIEEPNSLMAPADSDSDSELEMEGEPYNRREKENRDPFTVRGTKVPVIDRISLKRQSSSTLSSNTRLAFTALSSASTFKVPALLRRATTNSSVNSSTSTTVSGGMLATERMAGGAGSDGVRRGGGKNSGVNYFARETERRAAVVKTEKRRELKRFKGAEVRRKAVGGLFGGGKFE